MAQFVRWLAGSEPPPQLIAPLPIIHRLRRTRILILLFAGFFLLVGLFSLPLDWPRIPVPLSFNVPLMLIIAACLLTLERSWKRFEQCRVAAAQEIVPWQAERQPLPDAQALTLPTTIRLRPSRWWTVWAGLLTFVFTDGLIALVSWPDWSSAFATALFWWGLFAVTIFMGGVIALLVAMSWRGRRVIEVTEEGMRSSWLKTFVGSGQETHWVRWQEARFFACYPARGSRKGGQVMLYELAGERDVVSWIWVQREKTRRPLEEPLLPFEEHCVQIQALTRVVVAKTGLMLYDLGKHSSNNTPPPPLESEPPHL